MHDLKTIYNLKKMVLLIVTVGVLAFVTLTGTLCFVNYFRI